MSADRPDRELLARLLDPAGPEVSCDTLPAPSSFPTTPRSGAAPLST